MISARTLTVTMLSLVLAAPAFAQTTHTVDQVGFDFVPADITIQLGDTVNWVWSSGDHTVTEGPGPTPTGSEAFDSLLDAGTTSFSVTFDANFLANSPPQGGGPSNVYEYYCIPHWVFSMVGTVTVQQPTPGIPAASTAGLVALGIAVVAAAAFVLRRRVSNAAAS